MSLPSREGEDAERCADLVESGAGRLELQVVVLVDVTGKDGGLDSTLSAGTVARADQDVEGVGLVGDKDKVLHRAVLLIGHVEDHLLSGNHVALDLVRGSSSNGAAVEERSSLGDRLLNLNISVSDLHQSQGSLGSKVGGADNIRSTTLHWRSWVGVDHDGVAVGGNVTIDVCTQLTKKYKGAP